jgi:hypothetical protein
VAGHALWHINYPSLRTRPVLAWPCACNAVCGHRCRSWSSILWWSLVVRTIQASWLGIQRPIVPCHSVAYLTFLRALPSVDRRHGLISIWSKRLMSFFLFRLGVVARLRLGAGSMTSAIGMGVIDSRTSPGPPLGVMSLMVMDWTMEASSPPISPALTHASVGALRRLSRSLPFLKPAPGMTSTVMETGPGIGETFAPSLMASNCVSHSRYFGWR